MSITTSDSVAGRAAARLLASVEAIPETPENYRALREAIRDAKALAGSLDVKA